MWRFTLFYNCILFSAKYKLYLNVAFYVGKFLISKKGTNKYKEMQWCKSTIFLSQKPLNISSTGTLCKYQIISHQYLKYVIILSAIPSSHHKRNHRNKRCNITCKIQGTAVPPLDSIQSINSLQTLGDQRPGQKTKRNSTTCTDYSSG